MLLTKSTTPVIGQIAWALGWLMNGLFWLISKIGLPNIGVAIILFTIVIYMCLLPLTMKQQRFSKMSQIMQPELKKIQDKYKNRKDQESMMKQNEEMQAVYKKYGVSATGSCVQLLVQMPILFALYRVIEEIPAYVTQVKAAFQPLVDNLIKTSGSADFLQTFSAASQFSRQFTNSSFVAGQTSEYVRNTYIDVLNRISTSDWQTLANQYPALKGDIANTTSLLTKYNNFLGLSMSDTPLYTIRTAFAAGQIGLVIGAILIPLLSAFTQWLAVKLTPQQQSTGDPQQDSMQQQMKIMNVTMPLISAWFCFTLPAGMGLYWIAGAVIRTIQQVIINKRIDREDISAIIEKNMKKQEAKAAKSAGRETVSSRIMSQYATMNTRSIETEQEKPKHLTQAEKDAALKKAQEKTQGKYRKGSLAEKANMVSEYNNHKTSKD